MYMLRIDDKKLKKILDLVSDPSYKIIFEMQSRWPWHSPKLIAIVECSHCEEPFKYISSKK